MLLDIKIFFCKYLQVPLDTKKNTWILHNGDPFSYEYEYKADIHLADRVR